MQMNDKVAIVTGASQGIGEAVARRFAEEGARLVLSELPELGGNLESVVADLTARWPASAARVQVADLSDPGDCDALVAAAVGGHGRLDVVAHATAVAQRKVPVVELDPDEWDRVLAINAKGPFLLSRSAVPALSQTGGTIVFTGSFAGLVGQPERAAYAASKGALRLFTQSLALELADSGVRVNGVAPAFVESALARRAAQELVDEKGISLEEARAERSAAIPMRRQAEAREVADAFVYLATPASSYVTGTWLDVTGGHVLR